MRVCPKCDFHEPPIWRNRMAKRLYTQFCRLDELEPWEPELFEELKKEGFAFHDGVKYRLTKRGYVERLDAFLCKHPEPWNRSLAEPDQEKHLAKLIGQPLNQTRLVVGEEKPK